MVIMCLAGPAMAVEPDEILSDAALESRARDLSAGLRCPICRNESIDESNAALARDLRIILRERLVAGDSDAQAVEFLVSRYGEFILLKPTVTGANWLLWAAGPIMLLAGLGIGIGVVRRRPSRTDDTLSQDEQDQLRKILEN